MAKRRHQSNAECAIEMAEHLADLNVFAAIVTILEGSVVHAASYTTANRIIKICKDEQQKCLRNYDRQLHRLENSCD